MLSLRKLWSKVRRWVFGARHSRPRRLIGGKVSFPVPALRRVQLEQRTATRYRLDRNWELEFKQAQDLPCVQFTPLSGSSVAVAIDKQVSLDYCRVHFRVKPDMVVVNATTTFHFKYRTTTPDLLKWCAILQDQPGEGRVYFAHGDLDQDGSGLVGSGRVSFRGDNHSVQAKLLFSFQVSPAAGSLEITDLAVEIVAHETNHGSDALSRSVLSMHEDRMTSSTRNLSTKELRRKVIRTEAALEAYWKRLHAESPSPAHPEGAAARSSASELEQVREQVKSELQELKDALVSGPRSRRRKPGRESSTYVDALKSRIWTGVRKAAGEHPLTPYYAKLIEAVDATSDPELLGEVCNTIERVDMVRYGWRPAQESPLVSVIMPTRNRPQLTLDAVRSVMAQTYPNWELLVCDDASTDNTVRRLEELSDRRMRILRSPAQKGAAASRNACLAAAQGEIIAYLDSDNLWHPRYLEIIVEALEQWPGHVTAYASFIDVRVNPEGQSAIEGATVRGFHLEDQLELPFVDLNSFIHRRSLIELFGTFDEQLVRRQDYDLIARYCWVREPLHVPFVLNLYQRIASIQQITTVHRDDQTAPTIIANRLEKYYRSGVPVNLPPWVKKVTVISWDMSRNHFAKPYCVADALSRVVDVELVSFSFFETPMFEPLLGLTPRFEIKSFTGSDFPGFFDEYVRAVHAITGDIIYAVKPRLPSFGLALMSNYHTGKPIFLEANDLETVVGSPRTRAVHTTSPLEAVFDNLDEAKSPHSLIWSRVLDPFVNQIPTLYTHNINLDLHYGKRCLYMRNIKDATVFDPSLVDRERTRRELGFGPQDRVILFGGLVRKHKGIWEVTTLLERLADPRYKFLVVGNRETPDLRKLVQESRDAVSVLPPQSPQRMAELNNAADLVILWLDPDVPAGNYQSPYKMSDAFAMGATIIASPTSDLAGFGDKELLWVVPFGDVDRMIATIDEIFLDDNERNRRRDRARRFFEREFSYGSVPAAFGLGAAAVRDRNRVYPAATQFAAFFGEFQRRLARA